MCKCVLSTPTYHEHIHYYMYIYMSIHHCMCIYVSPIHPYMTITSIHICVSDLYSASLQSNENCSGYSQLYK